MREEVSLLAYSPLARGRLSGKYLGGALPEGSSKALDPRGSRYDKVRAIKATQDYVALADEHGLDPNQRAIAWVNQKPWVTSNIIGATTMDQLKINIDAVNLELSGEVIADIDAIHLANPNPSEQ